MLLIIISVIVSICILHSLSWLISVIGIKTGLKISNTISNSRFNQNKGLKKGKSKKFLTIKKGGVLSYLILIMFLSLLFLVVFLFIQSIITNNLYFQLYGLIFLALELLLVLFLDNVLIIQNKMDNPINDNNSIRKNYLNQRLLFFIEHTMFSFFIVVSSLILSVIFTLSITINFFPDFNLGVLIGFVILLSLYSNMFVLENYIYNNIINPLESTNENDIYTTQKKMISYLIIFVLGTTAWYEDLKNSVVSINNSQDFSINSLLITTFLLFYLSSDRIFKLINDDYVKFKKYFNS